MNRSVLEDFFVSAYKWWIGISHNLSSNVSLHTLGSSEWTRKILVHARIRGIFRKGWSFVHCYMFPCSENYYITGYACDSLFSVDIAFVIYCISFANSVWFKPGTAFITIFFYSLISCVQIDFRFLEIYRYHMVLIGPDVLPLAS